MAYHISMEAYEELMLSGALARVREIEQDGCRLHLELHNGLFVTATGQEPYEFDIGSVVFARFDDTHEEDSVTAAPESLWPEDSWIGVVHLILSDKTVVDASGRWKLLPTPTDINLRVGNTVEVESSGSVARVLSNDPLKYGDLPTVNDSVISKFKVPRGSITETFEDFGGFQDVVARAQELIEVPLKHKKELSKIGARPTKGVLFTGPPGTGKTMLARIIANSADAEFYEISGPQIFSKWYGESEEILRKLFEDAAKQKQAIVFFDEIDSVAGQRAEDSHEASRRVVAQLLTSMDGFSINDNVIVIAATNRPQDIDVALLRPGRFDWKIYFRPPNRHDRKQILEASARKLAVAVPLPHDVIAEKTESWSAAELAAIWSEAARLAASEGRSAIMNYDYVGGYERVLVQRRRAANPSMDDDS